VGKDDDLADSLVHTLVTLRIMATTDLHKQVMPYNYQTNQNAVTRGFSRTATLIRQARLEATNSILVDNGDFLCSVTAESGAGLGSERLHPMVSIMNHLGYDAATPGNHDFDYGPDFLTEIAGQADFPFLSANALIKRAQTPADDEFLFSCFTILNRDVTDLAGNKHRIRIGITGFLPPNSVAQYDDMSNKIQTRDIIEAAHNVVPQMKAAGADIIIALAHTGIGGEAHVTNMENAAVPLAEIDGIDAIIAGHRHQVFPGPDWPESKIVDAKKGIVHGKPLVAAGYWGSHLGIIDLDLVETNGSWQVAHHVSEARPIFSTLKDGRKFRANVRPDPVVLEIMEPIHDRLLRWITRPVGHTARPLNTFFALAAPSAAVQEIQRLQRWYVQENFTDYYDPNLPLLSSACAFKAGGYGGPDNFTDIAVGELTMRAVTDLYPFPNQIALLRVTGAGMGEWLERSASVFNIALPGEYPVDLKPAETPAYLFETVLGLEYAIDLSQPARYDQTGQIIRPDTRRIRQLSHKGVPVNPEQEFTLITNNFRLGGGGFYPASCMSKPLRTPKVELQKLLPTYFFKAHPKLDSELEQHWRFSPVSGARMRFRSSPHALDQMEGITTNNITPIGPDDNGYHIFELVL